MRGVGVMVTLVSYCGLQLPDMNNTVRIRMEIKVVNSTIFVISDLFIPEGGRTSS